MEFFYLINMLTKKMKMENWMYIFRKFSCKAEKEEDLQLS